MKNKIYIAYGSNLNLLQMRWRCPGARRVGSGFLKGWKLAFKGSKTGSYLTIMKDPKGKVPVGLFEVGDRDEAALDRYEGFPVFYEKKRQTVETDRGKVRGFVYTMREDAAYGVPSSRYMSICMEGYDDFGFEEEYLWEAFLESREMCDERR